MRMRFLSGFFASVMVGFSAALNLWQDEDSFYNPDFLFFDLPYTFCNL